MNRTSAIIVAAGAGKRFGEPKQFAYLKGKPVLEWTLEAFEAHPDVDALVLVLPDDQGLRHYQMRYPKIVDCVPGGEKRQDSVWQGFRLLVAAAPEIILVHDGARPLVKVPEVVITLGGIPTTPYATPGTDEVPEAIRGIIQEYDALLLSRHGAMTVGRDVTDAYNKMEKLEHTARVVLAARLQGPVAPLTPAEVEKLPAMAGAYRRGE